MVDFIKASQGRSRSFLAVGRVGSTSENITQRIECGEEQDKRSIPLGAILAAEGQNTGLTFLSASPLENATPFVSLKAHDLSTRAHLWLPIITWTDRQACAPFAPHTRGFGPEHQST